MDADTPARWHRHFELADGRIIEPCGYCGTPLWPAAEHHCAGADEDTRQRLAGTWGDGE